MTKKSGDKPN